MQLTEQHLIRKGDPRYAAIDAAAFASKNLYNQAIHPSFSGLHRDA
jgi:putative transposase